MQRLVCSAQRRAVGDRGAVPAAQPDEAAGGAGSLGDAGSLLGASLSLSPVRSKRLSKLKSGSIIDGSIIVVIIVALDDDDDDDHDDDNDGDDEYHDHDHHDGGRRWRSSS